MRYCLFLNRGDNCLIFLNALLYGTHEIKEGEIIDTFTIDLRMGQAETREVRDGNKMLMQGRANRINFDGTTDYGEWITTGIIENYGDVFDKKEKKGFFKWLFNYPYNLVLNG